MQLDAEEQSRGRKIVHDMDAAFVAAMKAALGSGDKAQAECVACECVVLAEEKDHSNWQLIGEVGKKMIGPAGKALKDAYKEVEDQQDENYYHSKGWMRELSMQALALKAVLPAPEERKPVKTAIG